MAGQPAAAGRSYRGRTFHCRARALAFPLVEVEQQQKRVIPKKHRSIQRFDLDEKLLLFCRKIENEHFYESITRFVPAQEDEDFNQTAYYQHRPRNKDPGPMSKQTLV